MRSIAVAAAVATVAWASAQAAVAEQAACAFTAPLVPGCLTINGDTSPAAENAAQAYESYSKAPGLLGQSNVRAILSRAGCYVFTGGAVQPALRVLGRTQAALGSGWRDVRLVEIRTAAGATAAFVDAKYLSPGCN